jgi:hypothetical protein
MVHSQMTVFAALIIFGQRLQDGNGGKLERQEKPVRPIRGGSKPGWCESLFVETELTVRIQVEQ